MAGISINRQWLLDAFEELSNGDSFVDGEARKGAHNAHIAYVFDKTPDGEQAMDFYFYHYDEFPETFFFKEMNVYLDFLHGTTIFGKSRDEIDKIFESDVRETLSEVLGFDIMANVVGGSNTSRESICCQFNVKDASVDTVQYDDYSIQTVLKSCVDIVARKLGLAVSSDNKHKPENLPSLSTNDGQMIDHDSAIILQQEIARARGNKGRCIYCGAEWEIDKEEPFHYGDCTGHNSWGSIFRNRRMVRAKLLKTWSILGGVNGY